MPGIAKYEDGCCFGMQEEFEQWKHLGKRKDKLTCQTYPLGMNLIFFFNILKYVPCIAKCLFCCYLWFSINSPSDIYLPITILFATVVSSDSGTCCNIKQIQLLLNLYVY